MKVLFDSDKNWDTVNAEIEKAWCDDPEMVYDEWCETFLDDMRTIKIERMKIETTPQDIEFPKDKEYQNLSVGDLLAKIDWGKLKVFVDDANELRLEYVKERVAYKARIYVVYYDTFYHADAQVPLGAYVERELDELYAERSVDWTAASKLALASLRQMPRDALLIVNEISKRDFRDGKFDRSEAEMCDEYLNVAELLRAYRGFDRLVDVDDLEIVAVEHVKSDVDNKDYVCLHGVSWED
jgi:hypothetical protein